ncbi:hypothetical protein PLESTF_000534000 [Pleodorina starrii]|nr:hypothetical protein PLESTF_000534000 [Pleodorina starrii]
MWPSEEKARRMEVDFKLSSEARLALLLVLSLVYATHSVRTQPPGITRLLMSLPLVLLFTVAPLQFHESVVVSGSLGFLFGWLGNFKLIAFSADRGPLAHAGLGAGQWLLLLLLPYFPAKRGHARARSTRVALSLLCKVVLAAALTMVLISPLGSAHRAVRHTGYALYVWLWASLLLDGPLPLAGHLLGDHIPLQPAMDAPFAATPLREFWGRRYNQIVSAILKDAVFEPIMDGSWMATCGSSNDAQRSPTADAVATATADSGHDAAANRHCTGSNLPTMADLAQSAPVDRGLRRRPAAASQAPHALDGGKAAAVTAAAGRDDGDGGGSHVGRRRRQVSERRRWLAMTAAFVVSGLMHEACLMYMCGFKLEGSYRMMGFFLLQPLLIAAQEAAAAVAARVVPERIRASAAATLLQTALTLGLVLAAADELFWGPLVACRTDERGLAESAILSSGIGLNIMWVANFKLLAYSGGRGALSHPGVRNGLQWAAFLVLPFFPAKSNRAAAKTSTSSVVLGLLLKLGVWLGLTALLVGVEGLSPLARHLCYAVHFWMFVSLLLDGPLPLAGHLLGHHIPLQPAMDAPFAATSLREFWGRRYNQIVSATLQETVYKPILEGRWVSSKAAATATATASVVVAEAATERDADRVSPAPAGPAEADGGNVAVRAGPPAAEARAPAAPTVAEGKEEKGGAARRRTPVAAAVVGLATSFLVSGVMHEICLWFSCGGRLEGSYRMMGFFLLQPLLIAAQEAAVAMAARVVPERIRVSAAATLLQTALTLVLVLGSAEWFWGSMETCDAEKRGLAEVDGAMRWLVEQARASGLLAL